jgi:hypothetical protein
MRRDEGLPERLGDPVFRESQVSCSKGFEAKSDLLSTKNAYFLEN